MEKSLDQNGNTLLIFDMKHQLTNKEVMEFFEKIGFVQKDGSKIKIKELEEITGYSDSKIYPWFKGKPEAESAMRWEAWLLLNALFNPKAELVKNIRHEYAAGDAHAEFLEQPEFLLEEREQIKILKEGLSDLSEIKFLLEIMQEEHVEQLHKDHFRKIKEAFYHHFGIIGPLIQDKEAFRVIRNVEKALNIEEATAFANLQRLNKEYTPDKWDSSFIDQLLRLYDDYFKSLAEETLEKYLNELMNIAKPFDGEIPKKILITPAQEARIDKEVKDTKKEENTSKDKTMVKAKFPYKNEGPGLDIPEVQEKGDYTHNPENDFLTDKNTRFHFYIDKASKICRYSKKLNVKPDDYEYAVPYIDIEKTISRPIEEKPFNYARWFKEQKEYEREFEKDKEKD